MTINNESPQLRSKRFLRKVNTIYLFLKKQAGKNISVLCCLKAKQNIYPATNTTTKTGSIDQL